MTFRRWVSAGVCVILCGVRPGSALAESAGDVFASDGGVNAPGECGPAYAACAAARHLQASQSPYREAGNACSGDLNSALAQEDRLNEQLAQMATLKGEARSSYYDSQVAPTNDARTKALEDFRHCTQNAMKDLRPDDYPKSGVLLQGGIDNTTTPPGDAVPSDDAGWQAATAETLRKMNDALDPVATPLQNLSSVLNAIAPHYDMVSRSDTGLRVIKDILVDMGVGHLAGRAGGALRKMAGKAEEVADAGSGLAKAGDGVQSGGSGKLGGESGSNYQGLAKIPTILMGTTGYVLPPGMSMPQMLAQTPRVARVQEATHSCAQACARMVSETVNRMPVREQYLQTAIKGAGRYVPGKGTEGEAIAQTLSKIGVQNGGWKGTNYYRLSQAVQNGYPAVASFGKNHVAVVDAIVKHGDEEWVFLRNPSNLSLMDDESRKFMEAAGFGNYVTMTKQEFVELFKAGGRKAVFTNP